MPEQFVMEINHWAKGKAEISIYGEIGWDVDAEDFSRQIQDLKAEEITQTRRPDLWERYVKKGKPKGVPD